MKFITRKRLVIVGIVAAFVAAFAAIGALSKSTTSGTTTAVAATGSSTPGTAPSALWYWTMAVSPSDPNVLVLGTSGGLYRSPDGGKTWTPTGPKNVNATSVVQIGSSIYAGGGSAGPNSSPVARTGATRAASNGAAVVAVTTDGAKTWKVLHPAGLPKVTVQSLAADPANAGGLYAVLNNGKLYRSTDAAASFKLVSSKLGIPPWAIAVGQGGQFVGGDMDTGTYVSANGSKWQKVAYKDSRGTKMAMEYAVQPNDLTKILMSAFGIESSTDGGKTWHVALKSTTMFGPIAFASDSSTAYAVGFDGSVWHSTDAGKSWTKVS